MSVVEELKQVREWLSDESHWIKEKFARLSNGEEGWGDEGDIVEATCLLGACHKYGLADNIANAVIVKCLDQQKFLTTSVFNDHLTTTHSDIMRVLDCAIEKEELKDE